MENVRFKGIESALVLNSSLILKCNEDGVYNTTIYYREDKEKLGQIDVIDDALSNCILKAERILSKSQLQKNVKEFLHSLTGIDWLLRKDFKVAICKNNEYFSIQVSAVDEYPYLINGLFHINSSNGVSDLFEYCNGWANTLRTHIEPIRSLEKDL